MTMMNIDGFQDSFNESDQCSGKIAANMVIITTIDDQEKILSCLTTVNTETVRLNLNEKHLNDIKQNINKRSLPKYENESLDDQSKTANIKRRKANLTCVICGGSASGYNFDQITCESCKAFFRRNALQPIEKTKCLNENNSHNKVRCDIRYDTRNKCQRCRLLKCLDSGMRKDHILTPEEKQSKQQRLEENRRIRTTQCTNNDESIKNEIKTESPKINTHLESIIDRPSTSSSVLSESDWSSLHHIQNAYLSSLQSSPSASSVLSLELAADRMSIYMNTLEIQNYAALKLIHFLRQIPDFINLKEKDRLILVKHNLPLLFIIRLALTFDSARELIYDDNLSTTVSPLDEAFAHHCKSLFILCYGYEFSRELVSILRSICDIVNNDPILVQLLLLNMIFLKGLSGNDDHQASLDDGQHVYNIHSKYTDLLFRYLLEKSSFESAAIKIVRITTIFIRIQRLIRDFHRYIKNKVDADYINPLMKSLLNLT